MLVVSVVLIILFISYRFWVFKNGVEEYIRKMGGIKEVYSGFVNKLLDEGFEVRETTPNSVYLHCGTGVGKIGAELVATGKKKAEINMGEELPTAQKSEAKAKIGVNSNQEKIAEDLLSEMPSRKTILG